MMSTDRAALLQEIIGFAATDLLCYRAPHMVSSPLEGEREQRGFLENPLLFRGGDTSVANNPPTDALKERVDSPSGGELRQWQDAAFDPILEWVGQYCGAAFLSTDSVMPITQNAAAIAAVQQEFVAARDDELLALAQLTSLLGSALLTLAVWKKFIPIETAIAATRLDEKAAAERYGLDPVIEAKWASTEVAIRGCALVLGL